MGIEDRSDRSVDPIARVRRWIAEARSVVALTGAGISTDSGIPDFRGPSGLWTRNPEAEKLATLSHYVSDPAVRVRSWQWRLETQASRREPNPGHRALVDLERAGHLDLLVTQNVDGLHERAGAPDAIELHGRLDVARCTACQARVKGLTDLGEDPRCADCGARLRPGVVWFGESLPTDALERAFELARRCELLLVIGTSSTVQPAASLATVAKDAGARLIEINPGRTPISDFADLHFQSGCRDTLVAINEAYRRRAAPQSGARRAE